MLKLKYYELNSSDEYNIKSAELIRPNVAKQLGHYALTTLNNTAFRIGDVSAKGYEKGCRTRSKFFR